MAQIQSTINLLHTLFVVCLVFCCIFFVVSIIFFFVFDIRNIFNVLTGRSVKKTVKEMNEQNERTGQLRRTSMYPVQSKQLKKEHKRIQGNTKDFVKDSAQTDPLTAAPITTEPGYQQGANETEALQSGSTETTVLQGQNNETTVLQMDNSMETTVLQQMGNAYSVEIAQKEVDEQYGKFQIQSSTLLIHTSEVV